MGQKKKKDILLRIHGIVTVGFMLTYRNVMYVLEASK